MVGEGIADTYDLGDLVQENGPIPVLITEIKHIPEQMLLGYDQIL